MAQQYNPLPQSDTETRPTYGNLPHEQALTVCPIRTPQDDLADRIGYGSLGACVACVLCSCCSLCSAAVVDKVCAPSGTFNGAAALGIPASPGSPDVLAPPGFVRKGSIESTTTKASLQSRREWTPRKVEDNVHTFSETTGGNAVDEHAVDALAVDENAEDVEDEEPKVLEETVDYEEDITGSDDNGGDADGDFDVNIDDN